MPQSATEMLKADHHKVDTLFEQYSQLQGQAQPQALVEQICTELDIHAKLEEELFYPAVRAQLDEGGKQRIDQGLQEHGQVKELIRQLRAGNVAEASYDRTVQQLRDKVRHHVEEEESELLPRAEGRLGGELQRLGEQMQERKQQLMGT